MVVKNLFLLVLVLSLVNKSQCIISELLTTYSISGCTVTKFTGINTQWSVTYDSSGIGCQGKLLVVGLKSDLYATFEIYGQSSSANYITNKKDTDASTAFSSGIFTHYGQGNSTYVTVLARIDQEDGKLLEATFLMSKMSKGTNGQSVSISTTKSYNLEVKSISVTSSQVQLVAFAEGYAPSVYSYKDYFAFYQDSSDAIGQTVKINLDYELQSIQSSSRVKRILTETNGSAMLSLLGFIIAVMIL